MEEGAILDHNKFANECATNVDSVSKKIFEDLVVDEEGYFDQFDTELDNISKNSFVFLRPKW